MRIGLDIDDVLFPWSQYAHAACERAGITNGKQVTQWGMHLDYGCTSEQVWEVIDAEYDAGMLVRNPPYEGTNEILEDLRAAGHTIHLATARGFEGVRAEMIRKHTAHWLNRWQVPHDSLTFTKDKSLLNVDVFLDDGIHNVEALQKAKIRAFLCDQIHNQASTFPRVANLAAFAALIHEELAC